MILFTLDYSVDNNEAEISNYLKWYLEQIYVPSIKAEEELGHVMNLIRSFEGTEAERQAAIKAYRKKLKSLLETFQQYSVPKECSKHAALCMKYFKLKTENKPYPQDTDTISMELERISLLRLASDEFKKLSQQK